MNDRFGRSIEYLRLSLTERCTLKCTYCRADEGLCPKTDELTTDQFLLIVRAMASVGIRKVRLTGGEPMLRHDLMEIISGIRRIDGIQEIAMTTNAQHLSGRASALNQAGLDRLNISLDSLKSERYKEITGGGSLARALSGIDEALAAGFSPVKLNVVLLRGVNADEADSFIALTKDRPIHVRFIEWMPLGAADQASLRITGDELLLARPYLSPLAPLYKGQPSRDFSVPGHTGRVGFINPVSQRFCSKCNRMRVMSDGALRPCLGDNLEFPLRSTLDNGNEKQLADTIRNAIWNKPEGHCFCRTFQSDRTMNRIGG
jgi:cyclic pyranopterin phosphate synthase